MPKGLQNVLLHEYMACAHQSVEAMTKANLEEFEVFTGEWTLPTRHTENRLEL